MCEYCNCIQNNISSEKVVPSLTISSTQSTDSHSNIKQIMAGCSCFFRLAFQYVDINKLQWKQIVIKNKLYICVPFFPVVCTSDYTGIQKHSHVSISVHLCYQLDSMQEWWAHGRSDKEEEDAKKAHTHTQSVVDSNRIIILRIRWALDSNGILHKFCVQCAILLLLDSRSVPSNVRHMCRCHYQT